MIARNLQHFMMKQASVAEVIKDYLTMAGLGSAAGAGVYGAMGVIPGGLGEFTREERGGVLGGAARGALSGALLQAAMHLLHNINIGRELRTSLSKITAPKDKP